MRNVHGSDQHIYKRCIQSQDRLDSCSIGSDDPSPRVIPAIEPSSMGTEAVPSSPDADNFSHNIESLQRENQSLRSRVSLLEGELNSHKEREHALKCENDKIKGQNGGLKVEL